MISLGLSEPQTHGYRTLTSGAIRIEIADIVDVQHSDRQQATTRGRQQQQWVYRRCLHEVATNYANPAEEDEHRQIAKTGVPIWGAARRIGDGRSDCRSPEDNEQQCQEKTICTEGKPQKRQSRSHGRQSTQQHSPAHLSGRNQATLHGSLWPLSFSGVSTVDRISVVVGQIGKNLQQNGCQQTEKRHEPAELARSGRKRTAHDDTGRRQWQGARTHCVDPDRGPVRSRSHLGHITIKV